MFKLENVAYANILKIPNLEIAGNCITCIIGRSGSGKTTLIKLLNKLITADTGEIYYKDQELNELDAVLLRREVIMLGQIPIIFEGTIKDNLLSGLIFSEKEQVTDEKLLEIMASVHLSKSLEASAAKLSGGEKQRIALGRILLMKPEVLLLDEPSSSLDEETENLIFDALITYTKKYQKTLIMVTHSRNLISNFANNIIDLEEYNI